MMFKRFLSSTTIPKRPFEILQDNSGAILGLGAIGSGTFAIGLYVNQLRVYEEKLKVTEEKIKSAEERAEKKSLLLLYNIFTLEEYKNAKKKLLDHASERSR